jgi:hypothetical protein
MSTESRDNNANECMRIFEKVDTDDDGSDPLIQPDTPDNIVSQSVRKRTRHPWREVL